MGVQLGQLRCFLAVAEERHFTHAARELGVAQPSVSARIHRLEEELGTPLFHRMKGNITLTPAGEALLPFARRVVGEVEAAEREVRELAGLARGRLSVGATPSLTTTLLPPVLARFHAAYPGIDLVLREAGSRDLVRSLEEGALDVALVILPLRHDVLETVPLLREELVAAVSRTHGLAKRRSIAMSELRGVPLVMFRDGYDLRSATINACRQAGFEPTFAVEGGEMDGVLRLATAGLGVAVVPSLVVGPKDALHAVRLVRPALTRTIGLARRRDRPLSRAGQAFADGVRALLRERGWLRRVPPGLVSLEPRKG